MRLVEVTGAGPQAV